MVELIVYKTSLFTIKKQDKLLMNLNVINAYIIILFNFNNKYI